MSTVNRKVFKLGGKFRLSDFYQALATEEGVLNTVNRTIKQQLVRLEEEYNVLKRRKAKLEREAAERRVLKPGDEAREASDDDRDDVDDSGDHSGESDGDGDGDAGGALDEIAANKKRRTNMAKSATKRPRYTCGRCGKPDHNKRTCPELKGRKKRPATSG